MDDITRQALKRAHRRISEGRWTQGPLFDGHRYCLLGSVGEHPRAVDEIAKVLGYRRFKYVRIAFWNDCGRRRRRKHVEMVLRDALDGQRICGTTGTSIDDLDLRPLSSRLRERSVRESAEQAKRVTTAHRGSRESQANSSNRWSTSPRTGKRSMTGC